MTKHAFPALACALTIGILAPGAHAEMSPDELARLGKDLTPNGAIMAGNADGTIPAWTGGLTQPPSGWDPKMGYIDPFKDEKPLFTITAANVDSYGDKVSPGMAALLKKFPNQAMPVYKTHRTFANPPEIYAATKEKAAKAKIVGLGIENYDVPGTPFPVPKTGVEAIYNQTTKYFGGYKACRDWLPVRASGDYYRVGFCEHMVQGQNVVPHEENLAFMIYAGYDAPSTLLGTIYLVRDSVDYTKPGAGRQAWIYNAGQRRVRRAPDLAYDNVDDGTEGMRTTDDYWGFQGAIDRYDWNLVGKKEMYIPYNAYRQMDPSLKYADMIDKGGLKPELTRWELHRVWVLEATLKPGMSHVLSKRVFYLDEDSHIIALADGYDGRGNLWRVYTYPLVQAYDAGVMFQTNFVTADLSNGNYMVTAVTNQRPQPAYQWNVKGEAKDFTTEAIRRRGVR
ncbi:DUF1329 domain-containing protein [Castellaniella defragrans]|uniref:DUF1329 domain-containing protein n=1 Tax=Castellaniella defragrans TaxID=75697 RepID=A0A7W9TR30_CASDE|nr:DUF1329 domain-containing protein [Castellaniella defragrans]KAB0622716.1 DUF1329 domain-containing protein [Castellaniella defragrans]MBB6085269.1 hypothetical protein [Castellaniella defragrans]